MIQDNLRGLLSEALSRLESEELLDANVEPSIELERPARAEHGDFSTNLALTLKDQAKMSPRELADRIVQRLPESNLVSKVEVAGAGFINFFLSDDWLHQSVVDIAEAKDEFGKSHIGEGQKVQVEFVSANPTGPLTVGSGRNAAYGDALANLLQAAGYSVDREYYLNDVGHQMDRFARSLEARYLQATGHTAEVPEDGYQGNYLIDFGKRLAQEEGLGFIGKVDDIREWGLKKMIESHRKTLDRFGIQFDNWFSERTLHDSGRWARLSIV